MKRSKRNVTYRLSEEVVDTLDFLTYDPVCNRNKLGLKSSVIEALIRKLIEARKTNTSTINVTDILEQLP